MYTVQILGNFYFSIEYRREAFDGIKKGPSIVQRDFHEKKSHVAARWDEIFVVKLLYNVIVIYVTYIIFRCAKNLRFEPGPKQVFE